MNSLKIRNFGAAPTFVPFDQVVGRLMGELPWTALSPAMPRESVLRPAADAQETDDAVILTIALPGLKPEDVEVGFEDGALTVSGQLPARDESLRWVLAERPQGQFHRRFTLKPPIDADAIQAQFAHGVLTLTLPKSEQVKPRKIAVQAG
mgnify:CR=1 FL=1